MSDKPDGDVLKMQKLVDLALYIPQYSYPMYENAPRPDGEFAAIRVANQTSPGMDEHEYYDDNGETVLRVVSPRVLEYEVLFTAGYNAMDAFVASFYRQDMQDLMHELDMSILHHEPIENDSTTLETNWEIRYGLKVMCFTRRVYEHRDNNTDVTTIENVEVDGVVNEGEDTIELTAEIYTEE